MSSLRFDTKDPTEAVVLTYDFTNALATGETLTGTPTVSVTAGLGNPVDTATIQNGVATLSASTNQVLVPVKAGTDGCDYVVKVTTPTSNAAKVLALAATLPVRT